MPVKGGIRRLVERREVIELRAAFQDTLGGLEQIALRCALVEIRHADDCRFCRRFDELLTVAHRLANIRAAAELHRHENLGGILRLIG